MDQSIILGGKFRVLNKLGSGSFGQIFECESLTDNLRYAVKIERATEGENSQLNYESKLYQILQGSLGICKMLETGRQDGMNYLVIEKLGQSLQQLLEQCSGTFNRKTMLMLADQIISRIEFLHIKGFVHRDIKPNNFMTGRGQRKNIIYLIDFGLAKRFKDFKTNEHIKQKTGKSLVGTARYASIASHEGYQQCRRDDLESIGYLLVYMVKGRLPWQGVKSKVKSEKFDKIGQIKKVTTIQSLCEGYPELQEYMGYLRKVEFNEEPDYNYLKMILRSRFVMSGYTADYFQWDEPKQQKTSIKPIILNKKKF